MLLKSKGCLDQGFSPRIPSMNLPNILSFSRVPLLFVVLTGLMLPCPGCATLALVAFMLAMLSDWLDGFFARLFRQATHAGALMDALIDKVFLLGLFFYFLHIGLIPEWGLLPLLVMMTREFVITGLRQCALLQGRMMSTEMHGKVKTVLQFLSAFLLILVPFCQRELGDSPAVMAWADFFKFAGRITFGLAAILTITSGIQYLRRYWGYLSYNRESEIAPISPTRSPMEPHG